MHRIRVLLIYSLMIASAASLTYAQEGADPTSRNDPTKEQKDHELVQRLEKATKNWKEQSEETDREIPQLKLGKSPDVAIYESELRYRMISQIILLSVGFSLAVGVLHLIQVKLKIHRGYFWFMVGGVIVLMVINSATNSYRKKAFPAFQRTESETTPIYAPTSAK